MSDAQAVNEQSILMHSLEQSLKAMLVSQKDCHAVLNEINTGVASLVTIFKDTYLVEDKEEGVTLQADVPYKLNRHGRRYLAVWTPSPITGIAVRIGGLAGTLTLAAGWNFMLEPDGTELTLAHGTSDTKIRMLYTNWLPGGTA